MSQHESAADEVRSWLDERGFTEIRAVEGQSTDIEAVHVGVPMSAARDILVELGRRAPTRWEALALLPSEDGAGVELHVRWRTT